MKIAILDLCTDDPGLDHHGTIGSIVSSWLEPHMPDDNLVEISVAVGCESVPEADAYDGYVLSGSDKGVYDEAPWMQPMRDFLLETRKADIPVFGICFGHQLMADVYGGKAEKTDKGFEVGPREFVFGDQTFAARVMHQDQVTVVPPGAEVTASAPYCPVAALQYGFSARSVQFHPEYSGAFISEAVEYFDGSLLSPEEAEKGRASISAHSVQDDLYGAEIAAFFHESRSD